MTSVFFFFLLYLMSLNMSALLQHSEAFILGRSFGSCLQNTILDSVICLDRAGGIFFPPEIMQYLFVCLDIFLIFDREP